MGKTRINQYMGKGKDHENPVEGGKARWHGSERIFYQGLKNYGLKVALSFSSSLHSSNMFPLRCNIYEDLWSHLHKWL